MDNFPLNILTFPIWWYSVGLSLAFDSAKQRYWFWIKKGGIVIFARHLSEPLFGDYSRTGVVVSFFIRIFLIIYKLIVLLVEAIFILLFFIAYLLLLPAVIVLLVIQLMPKI